MATDVEAVSPAILTYQFPINKKQLSRSLFTFRGELGDKKVFSNPFFYAILYTEENVYKILGNS